MNTWFTSRPDKLKFKLLLDFHPGELHALFMENIIGIRLHVIK